MKRRLLAIMLGAAVTMTALAGCGGSQNAGENAGGNTEAGTEDKSSGSEKDEGLADGSEEAGQEEGAADGSGEANAGIDAGELETVSLRLVLLGDMSSRQESFFKNEFHDAILDDLNIDLTIERVAWGEEATLGTMMASGEKFAVMNILTRNDWAAKGYLAAIDEELIKERCANYLNMRGENGFECVKYEGDIYVVPFGNKAYSGGLQYFDVRNDVLTDLGYSTEEITTMEQLEEVMAANKEQNPDMRILTNVSFLRSALASEISPGELFVSSDDMSFAVINELEEGDQVYSYYESEAFKNLCEVTARWADLDYVQKDEITNPSQSEADWNSGNCFMRNGMPGALISTSLKAMTPEAEEGLIKIGDNPNIIMADYDWGISVSAGDKENVARWLDLFDWMYQDQEHYNMCIYGVEGEDWEYNEDETIKKLVTDTFIEEWFMSAMAYQTYDAAISEELIERYESFDEGAVLSKTSGFAFDSTPVATEYAMLTSIYSETIKPMFLGYLDYEANIDQLTADLKNAGIDDYVAEYQRQFSEWYAAK